MVKYPDETKWLLQEMAKSVDDRFIPIMVQVVDPLSQEDRTDLGVQAHPDHHPGGGDSAQVRSIEGSYVGPDPTNKARQASVRSTEAKIQIARRGK